MNKTAGLDISKFIAAAIGAVICLVVVVTVAIPIISSNQAASSVANADAINSMINIAPLLMVVGVIVAIVATFVIRSKS